MGIKDFLYGADLCSDFCVFVRNFHFFFIVLSKCHFLVLCLYMPIHTFLPYFHHTVKGRGDHIWSKKMSNNSLRSI